MNKTIVVALTILGLSGCASHHETQQQINKQVNQNLGKAVFGHMTPLTPTGKPLTSYNLNGYHR